MDGMRSAIVFGVALTLGGFACSKENNVNVDGSGGTTSGQLPELPDCSELGSDPGSGGPSMLAAGRLDGTCFWIDEQEVSVAQYNAFLSSSPDPSSQAVECDWNDSLEPGTECGIDDADENPITCVDWCDAQAYCRSVGKVLCRDDNAKPADAEVSSWFSACSAGQRNDYPYGDDYRQDLCNGADFGEVMLRSASQQTGCAAENGAINLSGNAAEWVDACNNTSGATDDCLVRGGSYKQDANALRCETTTGADRETQRNDIGFRCCAYED